MSRDAELAYPPERQTAGRNFAPGHTQVADLAPAPIVAVLLADGWHHVASGLFTVRVLGVGDRGVLGYRFEETAETGPYGPATLAEALLAVPHVTPRGPPHIGADPGVSGDARRPDIRESIADDPRRVGP